MKVVFIGDVVGKIGCAALSKALPLINHEYGANFTIVNGENSAEKNGIDKSSMQMIFDSGADVITTGNHAFRRSSINPEFEQRETLIRPANYGSALPGRGICEIDCGAYSVAVINLVGTAFMQPADNPFLCAEKLLESVSSKIIIVDFHAEATSEKRAMGHFLAGRVSAVLGTHTHVQTADEQIMNGTGYITDVGMAGPIDSVLGVQKEIIIEKFRDYRAQRYLTAEGMCEICGVALEIDPANGKCQRIERLRKKIEPSI